MRDSDGLGQKAENRLEIGVLYGFRALMVLFVVNYHVWQQSWLPQYFSLFGWQLDLDFFTRSGYLFVDGMLLLSGFLLYLPHARAACEPASVPGVKRFYLSRLVRILPSYLLAVFVALFCFALPQGMYASAGALWRDVLSHLSFTFLFSAETYVFTPLNAGLWTIAVEMQFYLIFPLLARAAGKKPALTFSLMAAAGMGYRACVSLLCPDTTLFLNQMPAFLDVYALGMLGALGYCRLRRLFHRMDGRGRAALRLAATCAFAGGVLAVIAILRVQSTASAAGHAALRLSQMRVRLPLAVALLSCMLGASAMPRPAQKLLDNRILRFVATISYNLYIWHQVLAVWMRAAWFPETLHTDPGLQRAYTALCLSVAVVVAMLVTFGLEKPVARFFNQAILNTGRKRQHEGFPSGEAEPSADSVFVRAQEGGKGAD